MSQTEVKDFEKILIAYKEEIITDKEEGKQLLIRLGVLTGEGEVNKTYEDVCIPQDQD